ncbi:deaminase reductase [Paractinoplanes tereljensis]|uniref:Deaminase reductase n=1 Tax=Paractinoplanes tereljensis TaxID=571912 RepID=A0A919NPR6_9ACTN|nr:deaminase reductase [Actinoplanes tereljensis]
MVSQNITLDGVVQDPTGEEGIGGWFNRIGDRDRAAWAQAGHEEATRSAALLLGRRSYEYLAARWTTRTGDWADRLRALPKYVVSSTAVPEPTWGPTTVISTDLIPKLKEEIDGDIVVNASTQLARTLLAENLTDEIRLIAFPFLAGRGGRLFDETPRSLRLTSTQPVGDNLILSTYALVQDA